MLLCKSSLWSALIFLSLALSLTSVACSFSTTFPIPHTISVQFQPNLCLVSTPVWSQFSLFPPTAISGFSRIVSTLISTSSTFSASLLPCPFWPLLTPVCLTSQLTRLVCELMELLSLSSLAKVIIRQTHTGRHENAVFLPHFPLFSSDKEGKKSCIWLNSYWIRMWAFSFVLTHPVEFDVTPTLHPRCS